MAPTARIEMMKLTQTSLVRVFGLNLVFDACSTEREPGALLDLMLSSK